MCNLMILMDRATLATTVCLRRLGGWRLDGWCSDVYLLICVHCFPPFTTVVPFSCPGMGSRSRPQKVTHISPQARTIFVQMLILLDGYSYRWFTSWMLNKPFCPFCWESEVSGTLCTICSDMPICLNVVLDGLSHHSQWLVLSLTKTRHREY